MSPNYIIGNYPKSTGPCENIFDEVKLDNDICNLSDFNDNGVRDLAESLHRALTQRIQYKLGKQYFFKRNLHDPGNR